MSRKTKFLSTALVAVAVVATVAVARTIHTQAPPAEHARAAPAERATTGSGTLGGAAASQMTPAQVRGIFACGPATPLTECYTMETLLPQ